MPLNELFTKFLLIICIVYSRISIENTVTAIWHLLERRIAVAAFSRRYRYE